MMDWAKITSKVEHALTLQKTEIDDYLASLPDEKDVEEIKRLLELNRPDTHFLATSAPDYSSQSKQIETDTVIGLWKIVTLVGEGGMGSVYKAIRADGLYEQTVALKILHKQSEQRNALFNAERKRLAMMNHPNIARIIDGGTTKDGQPYMAMEYVDGVKITDFANKRNLPEKARLSLFLKVCDAVIHAHNRLILHRDIKSGNVLVSEHGNVSLLDFGISSNIDGEDNTVSAFSIATAAPEQLKGEPVSVETDIFSLGVLLHELLINVRPDRLPNGGMSITNHKNLHKDLVAILETALALKTDDRYQSVIDLRDDIVAYLEYKPVAAKNGTIAYRFSKFVQRNPLANALGLMVLMSLIGGLGFSLKFASDAKNEANKANIALAESQQNLARANFYLQRADLFHATQSAYADSLQSMFGGDADVERQTNILKQRWQQAYHLRDKDPDNAAFLSYAIGRHFLFRNDYVTAIEIFKPWIEEAYGPEPLIGYAKQMLALAYMSTGKEDLALPILRDTERWLASSFDAHSPDHIASATQIAILSKNEKDILLAEELLTLGLEEEQNKQIQMYFYNQLSKMRQMRGNFALAYDAMKKVVDIIESSPLMELSGTDTGYLNLANFELWYLQDFDRAAQLADKVVETAHKKGESRELGLAYSVLARVYLSRGEKELALEYIERAIGLSEKYTGEKSETTMRLYIDRAEILANLSKRESLDIISELKDNSIKENRIGSVIDRLKLADVYVTYQLEGFDLAQQKIDELGINLELTYNSIELAFTVKKLEKLGLTL